MSMYDKNISKEKLDSLEFAEAAREEEWKHPSFALQLFHGDIDWDLIRPFPEPDDNSSIRRSRRAQPIRLGGTRPGPHQEASDLGVKGDSGVHYRNRSRDVAKAGKGLAVSSRLARPC